VRVKLESLRDYYGNLWINAYNSENRMIHIKLRKNSPYYGKCRDVLERFIEIPLEEIEAVAKGHCGDRKERKKSLLGFFKRFVK